MDDFLFFYFVLPFLLFPLTHFNDPLHDLFLLLIYLLFLLLLFSQRHLHCLFHKLFLSPLFSLNHLLSNFDLLSLLCRCSRHWVLSGYRCLLLAGLWLWLLSLAWEHLDGLLVQLCVALNHESLESDEVIHSGNLINDLFMKRVRWGLLTSHQELFLSDSQIGHQLWEQIIHRLFELLLKFHYLLMNNFLHCESKYIRACFLPRCQKQGSFRRENS